MSLKIKALGLGLIAALAMSAVAVMGASAKTGGHFTSGTVTHTILKGADIATKPTKFTGDSNIECKKATYAGTTAASTVESITITPTYHECRTEGSGVTNVHVRMNGCDYLFTIGEKATEDNTVHLNCPGEKGPEIEVTATSCLITVLPNQTPTGGVVYNTATHNGVHGITAEVTVEGIKTVAHGGFFKCATVETNEATAKMHGTATLEGFDTDNVPVGITATGSSGS